MVFDRKIFRWLMFCAVMAAVFFSTQPAASAASPLRVLTSFYPVYVAALNVADGVGGTEVHNLANPRAGCLHDYQLTTGDARKLANADLFLANGAGMESFLEKIRAQYPRMKIVEVSDGIPLIGDNPHVWTSPGNARRQVENIAAVLSAADPGNADRYASNARAYGAKLSAVGERLKSELAPFSGTPVVTLHDSLPYLARDAGLDIAGVIEREPGLWPGARELAAMTDLVRARNIRIILAEPQYSDRAAQIIARETGATVFQVDSIVTGPSDPAKARDAYLRAMEQNLEVLRGAFRH